MPRRFACVLFLTLACSALAQQMPAVKPCAAIGAESQTARPRIGLALEGGSAFGLAHIGVLQALEKQHIPIDCIAGTSMGGLIGGFYATGMTPEKLKDLVESKDTDWDQIVGGATPYPALSFRRKEDRRALPNSIVLGLQDGLSLPAGLNAGEPISLLIDKQTLAYDGLASFDDLPIPFRCVATDIITGQEEDFHDGALSKALRATMSIPGLFTPVNAGEKLYVDGGVVNNLPSDVVRAMGADIVIAVHLETAPVRAKDVKSLLEVLGQTARSVISQNEKRGRAGANVTIWVDLSQFNALEFQAHAAIIAQGLVAAEAKEPELHQYAIADNAQWEEYLRQRKGRAASAPGTPRFVAVAGTGPEATAVLEHALQPLAGKPIDSKKLEKRLTRLTGTGNYDVVDYGISHQGGRDGLLITVHETTYAPPMIQPAFQVDGGESSNVNFTLGARLTFVDIAGYRSEWRTDFQFGNTYGVQSEFYRPFSSSSKWFVAPHANASDTTLHLFAKNDPVADYRVYRDNIGADVGYEFGNSAEVRAGYELGFLSNTLRLGTPQLASVEGRVGAARLHFLADRTDGAVVPRNGYSAEATFRWFDTSPGASEPFPTLDARVSYYHPLTAPASVFFSGEGGSTLGFNNTGLPQSFLGGPFRLSAYGQNELRGNQYYLGRAGYRHDLWTLPPFVGKKVYAVASWEVGKMYGVPTASRFPNDVTSGLFAETALGPLFLGYSVGDSGHQKWFFFLGRVF
ncbi:MAG TPA: patatin-like phospholipase family protein [Verrucomicrobiae bacterium]|jgi:NTE family protein|nr:patatin-like phospholipase family protein [Verrucomicrobiae bacterium]